MILYACAGEAAEDKDLCAVDSCVDMYIDITEPPSPLTLS